VSGSVSGDFVSGSVSGDFVSGSGTGDLVSGSVSGDFMSGSGTGDLMSGSGPGCDQVRLLLNQNTRGCGRNQPTSRVAICSTALAGERAGQIRRANSPSRATKDHATIRIRRLL
jgi:hypothetical protein